jgi:hypothetical protein
MAGFVDRANHLRRLFYGFNIRRNCINWLVRTLHFNVGPVYFWLGAQLAICNLPVGFSINGNRKLRAARLCAIGNQFQKAQRSATPFCKWFTGFLWKRFQIRK